MKAIVLCAGQGSRLRPLTDDRPKGMVEVGGVSILQRQVTQLRSAGVDDIVVIGGYRHDTIPDRDITKYVNKEYEVTNMVYSLFAAESELVAAEQVIVSYGDIIYSPAVLQAVLESANSINVVIDLDWHRYFSQRSDNVLEDAETLRLDGDRVSEIGGVPESVDQIEGQYIGLMKFDRTAIESLREIFHTSMRDNRAIGWGRTARKAFMTDLLQECIRHSIPVHAVSISGGWCEIDTLDDYGLAQRMLPSIIA